MTAFKEWLRKLSSVQTGIFYLSIVLFFVFTVMHDPLKGYALRYDVIERDSIEEVPVKYRESVYRTSDYLSGKDYYSYNVYGSPIDPRSYLSVSAVEKELRKNREERRRHYRGSDGKEPEHDRITSLSGYLMLCGMLALMTRGAIWLAGIRES